MIQTGFIHFRQFPGTLGSAGRKAPSQELNMEFFQNGFIHFRQFSATFSSAGRKGPPLQELDKNIFRLDLYVSGNFQKLWVQLAKMPAPRVKQGNMIQTGFIHFRQFPAVLVQLTEKAPSSARAEQGFFFTGFIHFRQCPATFIPARRKAPPTNTEQGKRFWT